MADGDAASAIGLAILTGVERVKDMWAQINATRDMIANHIVSGAHSAAQITSGVLNIARIPTLDAATKLSGIAPAASELDNGAGNTISSGGGQYQTSGAFAVIGAFAATGAVTAAAPYSTILSTSYRSLYVRDDGRFGYVPSARRFKKNVQPAQIDPAAVLALVPVEFDYKAAYGGGHDTGLIAEDVAAAGLGWLTLDGDGDGVLDGIAYERLAVALLAVARDQQTTIADLARRVKNLEGA